jgi:hypothetical protein
MKLKVQLFDNKITNIYKWYMVELFPIMNSTHIEIKICNCIKNLRKKPNILIIFTR